MKLAPLLLLAALPASASTHKPIARKMGGLALGLAQEKAQRMKAAPAPKELADLALPGETILVFPAAKAKGARGFLGHFRDGRLRRIEWTYEKSQDWGALLKIEGKRHGAAVMRRESMSGRTRDLAEWSDGKTRLTYTRDSRPDGVALYGSLEDVPMTEAAYKSFAAEAKMAAKASLSATEPSDVMPRCLDYSACYNLADQEAKAGRCGEAVKLYGKAIELKPDRPWAWYHRAVLRLALGDEAGAKDDHAKALERKANDEDPVRMFLQKPREVYGPDWACLP